MWVNLFPFGRVTSTSSPVAVTFFSVSVVVFESPVGIVGITGAFRETGGKLFLLVSAVEEVSSFTSWQSSPLQTLLSSFNFKASSLGVPDQIGDLHKFFLKLIGLLLIVLGGVACCAWTSKFPSARFWRSISTSNLLAVQLVVAFSQFQLSTCITLNSTVVWVLSQFHLKVYFCEPTTSPEVGCVISRFAAEV